MNADPKGVLYVVVDVMSGVVSQAGVFGKQDDAEACARRVRNARNLDKDDVQVFQCILDDDSFE